MVFIVLIDGEDRRIFTPTDPGGVGAGLVEAGVVGLGDGAFSVAFAVAHDLGVGRGRE
jgi:hypothetical protein